MAGLARLVLASQLVTVGVVLAKLVHLSGAQAVLAVTSVIAAAMCAALIFRTPRTTADPAQFHRSTRLGVAFYVTIGIAAILCGLAFLREQESFGWMFLLVMLPFSGDHTVWMGDGAAPSLLRRSDS
jgi:hypothetical protein